MNNEYDPQFSVVKDTSVSVVSRAYSTLLKASTQSTVNTIYAYSQKTNTGFNLQHLDRFILYNQLDPFNTEYMRQLFALGLKKGTANVWEKEPPLGRPIQNDIN